MRYDNRLHRMVCALLAVAMLIVAVLDGGLLNWAIFVALVVLVAFNRPSTPPPSDATPAHRVLHYFGLR